MRSTLTRRWWQEVGDGARRNEKSLKVSSGKGYQADYIGLPDETFAVEGPQISPER